MRKAAFFNWLAYRSVAKSRIRVAAPRWRVGIYKVDRLGDFVLSLGAIRRIVEAAGVGNCVLFHSAAAAGLAAREFPDLARVELPELDGKLWVTRRRLADSRLRAQIGGGVEQLLSLRHFRVLFDAVALQAIPAREVWCVGNSPVFSLQDELVRRPFGGDVVVPRPAGWEQGENCEDLACHRALLEAWDRPVRIEELRPRLAGRTNRREDILALAPFGSHRIRDLPFGGVAACCAHARRAHGLTPVLLAPPNSVSQYEAFARSLAGAGVTAEVRVTATVGDLVDTLAASAAVVTTETATAHLAAALDLPMLCTVGGGHFGLFAPWRHSERQQWLSHALPCFNCGWKCPHPEPYCITRVTAEQMVSALDRVLRAAACAPAA